MDKHVFNVAADLTSISSVYLFDLLSDGTPMRYVPYVLSSVGGEQSREISIATFPEL